MKWTFVAFLASLLTGYYIYDEFDPGILCYITDEFIYNYGCD